MQYNLRVYVRCLYKLIIEENFIVSSIKYIKKAFLINYEILNKQVKLEKRLNESNVKLNKAKTIIDSNAGNSVKSNFFNLVK